ncbi:tyrosine-type recombinase/integrase [Rhodomicrobium sp. Az07]|uniref:DUF6538 domain-containing protein n=1 Tax=Rhodomicrobium sp. Az07 TaxID=2839034 RepID=UPI001BEA0BCE|nr:tyrosine-type recombinase/integrase [Rhodomicrobium sp. Az07]
MKDTTIFKRADTWQLRRRVPARYAPVEERKVIWLSLHTDSESVARRKAAAAWVQLEEAWEARLAGDTNDAEKRYAAALNLCGMRGFRYLPAEKIAALPEEERIRRVEAVASGKPERFEAAALLGGVANPPLTVTRALDLYWTLAKDRTLGKSEDQLRRWKNPRMKAVKNFAHVIGAKPLAEITADDVLNFREWWIEKIEAEDLSPSSANKDFTHLADMVRTLNRMKRLGLPDLFRGVALKEGAKRTRPPFSTEWIRMRLIAPGALDGLNTEARCIVLGMVNTGYRPSEAAGLLPDHIRLEGPIPFISIEPVGRQLKNETSKRIIPLAGVSLEAFRECKQGFPRYRNSSATLSATVNSYFRENGLLETEDHSLYSLRHSFEDRLIATHADERIRRDLFGHAYNRERYGKGGSLERLRETILAAAL